VLPAETLATARAWVRQDLQTWHLPSLPEEIEEALFLAGGTAWTFRYADLAVEPLADGWRLEFTVLAILKKAFRGVLEPERYGYRVRMLLDQQDHNVTELTMKAAGPGTS
jgi:hypothetical protein